MAHGLTHLNMVMFGNPTTIRVLDLKVLMATGYGRMNMNGSGYQIITGVGLHSTMAAGVTILSMAGYGYLVINGLLHGCPGAPEVITMAGRL